MSATPNTAPAGQPCEPAGGKTPEEAGCTGTPNTAPAGQVCEPTGGKTPEEAGCTGALNTVPESTTTTPTIAATTIVVPVQPVLPVTGQSGDIAVVGTLALVVGVVAHRIARRKLISR